MARQWDNQLKFADKKTSVHEAEEKKRCGDKKRLPGRRQLILFAVLPVVVKQLRRLSHLRLLLPAIEPSVEKLQCRVHVVQRIIVT